MRTIAFILAVICLLAAVVYFVMPAGSLPTFMPGFQAGSAHVHTRHGIIAIIAAVILFLVGWLAASRR